MDAAIMSLKCQTNICRQYGEKLIFLRKFQLLHNGFILKRKSINLYKPNQNKKYFY